MNFDGINPLEDAVWDDLVASHPNVSIFHTSFWARLLAETYGYRPIYLVQRKDGMLRAAVPVMEVRGLFSGRRVVSLPFTDYCDPLLGEGVDENDVLHDLVVHGRKAGWVSLEIRQRGLPPPGVDASETFIGNVLDVPHDGMSLMERFRKSTQRNIRKAAAEGVSVEISCSDRAMEDFYGLNCLTRREHGLPPQPVRFFRNIARFLQKTGRGFVALASFKGQAVAGGVFLGFGDRAVFKYGASDKRFQSLRANNLVMFEAIRVFASRGARTFCFGRTERENEGLRQFKSGWGTREQTISYLKYDFRSSSFVKSSMLTKGLHNRIFRAMPLPLSRAIGQAIYKYMA